MKTNSKEFTSYINYYILSAIDGENYNKELNTDVEKLQFLADTFKSEYGQHIRYYGGVQETLMNWFMGLPSAIFIDFEYYRIIEIAKKWGSIPEDASAQQESDVCDNWFNLVAFKTIKLLSQHNISLT